MARRAIFRRAAALFGAAALFAGASSLMAQDRAAAHWASAPPVASEASSRPASGEPTAARPPVDERGGAPVSARPGAPQSVFDGDYVTLGLGVGLAPSYEGSNEYIVIPAPRFAGRLKGIEFSSASGGPGLALDLLRDAPRARIEWIAGPALRVNLNRSSRERIKDALVRQLDRRKTAVEMGGEFGLRINGVAARADSITFQIDVLFDVAGAHKSAIVTPKVSYAAPVSRAGFVQASLSASHMGDGYARHYFSVLPQEAARSGLPAFDASDGFKNISASLLGAYDLSGDALDGGLLVFAIGGYSRLLGDAADSPITRLRGSADQAFVGFGLGYTF